MLCDIWKCFVDVFKHEYLAQGIIWKTMNFVKIDELCQNEVL